MKKRISMAIAVATAAATMASVSVPVMADVVHSDHCPMLLEITE